MSGYRAKHFFKGAVPLDMNRPFDNSGSAGSVNHEVLNDGIQISLENDKCYKYMFRETAEVENAYVLHDVLVLHVSVAVMLMEVMALFMQTSFSE